METSTRRAILVGALGAALIALAIGEIAAVRGTRVDPEEYMPVIDAAALHGDVATARRALREARIAVVEGLPEDSERRVVTLKALERRARSLDARDGLTGDPAPQ